MSTYIYLLRGINVGGQKKLTMEFLRGIYTGMGFTSVRSYVQSGNILFDCVEVNPEALQARIEAEIESTCGYPVPVFIRTPAEFKHILGSNPFVNKRNEDPRWLHVTFLYAPPSQVAWEKLVIPSGSPDEFVPGEQAVYLFCPNGYGKTKLGNSFFERKLGVLTTTRNWNTVNALYRMAAEK